MGRLCKTLVEGFNGPSAICSVLLPERSADTRLTPSAPIIGILQSAGKSFASLRRKYLAKTDERQQNSSCFSYAVV